MLKQTQRFAPLFRFYTLIGRDLLKRLPVTTATFYPLSAFDFKMYRYRSPE